MDELSEAEEGRIRGGKQLREEARVNALVLLPWTANGAHLSYGAIADIARKSLCSPRDAQKICMWLLDCKKPFNIVKSKSWAMSMPKAMTRMILL